MLSIAYAVLGLGETGFPPFVRRAKGLFGYRHLIFGAESDRDLRIRFSYWCERGVYRVATAKEQILKLVSSPDRSSYLPDSPLDPPSMDAILSGHEKANGRLIDFVRLILIGTGAFSIVAFNAAISVLNMKAYEKGVPSSVWIEFLVLSLAILASFASAFWTNFHAAYVGEYIVYLRTVLTTDPSRYGEVRTHLVDEVVLVAAWHTSSIVFFFIALLTSIVLLMTLLSFL